jgi:hypothetical protein
MFALDTGKDYRTITIGTGAGAASAAVDLGGIGGLTALTATIVAPAALTGTVTILVSADGTTYGTLQSGGSDITIPQATAVPLTEVSTRYLKLKTSGTEAAERTFHLVGRGRGGSGDYR